MVYKEPTQNENEESKEERLYYVNTSLGIYSCLKAKSHEYPC